MNPADLTNALLYGIPLVSVFGCGYETMISTRGRHKYRNVCTDKLEKALKGETTDRLRIAVADSVQQLEAAWDLVKRRYVWRGYQCDQRGDGLGGQKTQSQTTLIVNAGDATVGTITVRVDGPRGLLAENTHPGTIDAIRNTGGKVCEITQLAIADVGDSRTVLAKLLSIAHFVMRKVYQATDIFIEVNPRHVDFYRRVLGFEVASGERVCARVGAPSVLLTIALDALEDRFDAMGMGSWVRPLLEQAA